MFEVIFKILDTLEPSKKELKLVEAKVEFNEFPDSGLLVSDSLNTLY